jgi:hypothetical protein
MSIAYQSSLVYIFRLLYTIRYMKITHEIDYKKTTIGLAVLLVLASIFILVLSCKNTDSSRYDKKRGENTVMTMNHDMSNMSMNMQMADMANSLKNKSGDELDKTFLAEMIVHHEGALEMAQTLKVETKRPELMKLADDIIAAQTKEIEQMKMWQKEWFTAQQ